MKIVKKIVWTILVIVISGLFGGYFYFRNKFSPPENYLTVSGTATNIPIQHDSAYSAICLPIQIHGIDRTFYMQLDTGSPITLFYAKPLKSVQAKFHDKIKFDKERNEVSIRFHLGNLSVSSGDFKVLDYGKSINFGDAEAIDIIGTIGTDLLEKRKTVLDFKGESCSFVNAVVGDEFTDFEFKERKILIPTTIGRNRLKLLYDSGTSGYELIVNKAEWEKYREKDSKIKKEKGNSWGNTLTVFSASANQKIQIGNSGLALSEVTYIEGTSQIQNILMKVSGMQGMTGNKLFVKEKLILDCANAKFRLE